MPTDIINDYRKRPAAISAPDELGIRPLYIPLPSGVETERFSGLKRGKINELILPCAANGFRPPVKSISLKPPGALKGKRLVVLASLLSYLARLEAEQLAEPVAAE